MARETICYFEGASVDKLRVALMEYTATDTRVKVLTNGREYWLQVCDTDGKGGDPINDSHPCPGSPGC